jgi:hypothetical protein
MLRYRSRSGLRAEIPFSKRFGPSTHDFCLKEYHAASPTTESKWIVAKTKADYVHAHVAYTRFNEQQPGKMPVHLPITAITFDDPDEEAPTVDPASSSGTTKARTELSDGTLTSTSTIKAGPKHKDTLPVVSKDGHAIIPPTSRFYPSDVVSHLAGKYEPHSEYLEVLCLLQPRWHNTTTDALTVVFIQVAATSMISKQLNGWAKRQRVR